MSTLPYTAAMKRAISHAPIDAYLLGDAWVSTEHLLLGVLHEPHGNTVRAVEDLGITVEAVLEALKLSSSRCYMRPHIEDIVRTPRADRVIGLAEQAACRQGSPVVDTPHLLQGLMDEGEGLAARILLHLTEAARPQPSAV